MNIKSIPLFLLLSLYTALGIASQEKLVFATDLIRHGDRTPTADIPKAPHAWPEGLGQLTATGMQQEYELGTTLRKIYVDNYHLLPTHYTTGTLYARSSDVDRTLMSGQACLMGLYPPGTGPNLPDTTKPALPHAFQPISIHTVDKEHESLLIPWTESAKFKEYLKTYVYPTAEWKAKTAELQPKLAAWSEATGIAITDIFQLKALGDALNIYKLYNVPMPAGLTSEDIQQIIDAGNWVFLKAFQSPEIAKLTGHDLLKTIADEIQQASEGKGLLKYKLLVSHDSTQLSLLSVMGAPLTDKTPPYASVLNFSLFENGAKNYFVRVSFNGKPVKIPRCGESNNCTLAQFASLTE